MNQDDYDALRDAGYSHIPVVHEILADLETPLSAYLKLADGPHSYLLESAAQGGEKWGRYSIIGLPSRTVVRVCGDEFTVEDDGVVVEESRTDDPLSAIEAFSRRFNVPDIPGLPRFFGGLVGYFGYDTVRTVEKRLKDSAPPDDLGTPDILLMVSTDVLVFDNMSSRVKFISLTDPAQPDAFASARARLETMAAKLTGPTPQFITATANETVEEEHFESAFGRSKFMAAVERIREYIRAGDVMQVVLSQRMSIPFVSPAINLYRALRSLNPSPYMYFMNLRDFHIVSSSPEILARVEDGVIVNRPLAGTRRRGRTEAEDLAMEKELVNDPKEIAEHLMLIDLGRNDVG
ncbi:MAG: chorismate-binding protein, partial [Gammaproteobacteria bacterium]|nr:chorismate-binding protein [Gammaproteobacteria bacterium]